MITSVAEKLRFLLANKIRRLLHSTLSRREGGRGLGQALESHAGFFNESDYRRLAYLFENL